ncbi:MAG: hypothetical protein CVV49_00085 [Spirochaetae bacterium HGW-Spirochaetae-5]|nr:MAG: hypothetical protein CVV49_00085 [Spirochaetae bacterium HGW-Spirochaetae-5]
MAVIIQDFQNFKTLTGFNFNMQGLDFNLSGKNNFANIPKKVMACRLKVTELTGLEVSLNNFLTVVESDYINQVISRFKGDIKISAWIGADTVFNAFTSCDENLAEADFISAGLFKLSESFYQDTAEGENLNLSQDYAKKSIALDLAAIKTAKGIVSSDVSIYFLVTASGTVNLMNAKDFCKLQYIFNFNLSGFFFKSSAGLDEAALIALGFLKEASAETEGFLKDASAVAAGFLKENKVYTGSVNSNINFPIGSIISARDIANMMNGDVARNQSFIVKYSTDNIYEYNFQYDNGVALSGTWYCRGRNSSVAPFSFIFQRVV